MSILERGARLGMLIITLFGLAFAPLALADDKDDVMAVIERYGDLEGDLEAQARLIGLSDRECSLEPRLMFSDLLPRLMWLRGVNVDPVKRYVSHDLDAPWLSSVFSE